MSMTVEELARVEDAPAIRPEVAAFALLMEQKLRENDHKGHWREADLADLLDGLLDEVGEFVGELIRPRPIGHAGPLREAADVGNYAMFIPDALGLLTLPPGVTCLRIEVRRP